MSRNMPSPTEDKPTGTIAYVWPVSIEDPAYGSRREFKRHISDFLRHLRIWNNTDWVKTLKEKIGPSGEITLISGFTHNDFTQWSLVLVQDGFRIRTKEYNNTMEGKKLHSVTDRKVAKDYERLTALMQTEPSLKDIALALETAAKDLFIKVTGALYLATESDKSTKSLVMPDSRHRLTYNLASKPLEEHSPLNRIISVDNAYFHQTKTVSSPERVECYFEFTDATDEKIKWGEVKHSIPAECKIGEIDRSLVRLLTENVRGIKQPEWIELKSSGGGVFDPHAVQAITHEEYIDALPLTRIFDAYRLKTNQEILFSFPQIEFLVTKQGLTVKSATGEQTHSEIKSADELRSVAESVLNWKNYLFRAKCSDGISDNFSRGIEDAVRAKKDVKFFLRTSSEYEGIREVSLKFTEPDTILISTPRLNWHYLFFNNYPLPGSLNINGYARFRGDDDSLSNTIKTMLNELGENNWVIESEVPSTFRDREKSFDFTFHFRPIKEGMPYRIVNFSATEIDYQKRNRIGLVLTGEDLPKEYYQSGLNGLKLELDDGLKALYKEGRKQGLNVEDEKSLKRRLFEAAECIMENIVSNASKIVEGGQTAIPLGTMRDFTMLGFGASITLRVVFNQTTNEFEIYFADYKFGDSGSFAATSRELNRASRTYSDFVWPEVLEK